MRHAPVLLAALVLLALTASRAPAQSGRATMHGYVAFDGIGYVDVPKSPRAKVELRATGAGSRGVVTVETDEHGSYDFKTVSPGEYALQITAPGFQPYKTEIYLPSDFGCSLATLLKKADGKKPTPSKGQSAAPYHSGARSMRVNKTQWVFVLVGLAVAGWTLLRPPQRVNVRALHLPPGTRQFYWIYPDGQGLPMETDWTRLTGTLAVITLVTAGAVLVLRTRRESA